LSRQIGQRLFRIDLRAPLRQDRFEAAQRRIVRSEGIRLRFRERARLSHGRGHEAETADLG
jgi:hypothetical protein